MFEVLTDAAAVGITLLGSGVGVKFLVSGAKVVVKDILPLIKQQPISSERDHCMHHGSMDEVVKQFEESSILLARIETKLDASMLAHSAHDKCIDEIYTRLRINETEIAIVKSKVG